MLRTARNHASLRVGYILGGVLVQEIRQAGVKAMRWPLQVSLLVIEEAGLVVIIASFLGGW